MYTMRPSEGGWEIVRPDGTVVGWIRDEQLAESFVRTLNGERD